MILGGYFIKCAQEAVKMRPEAVSAFFDLSDGIPEESKDVWRKMAEAWEADNTQPNPFESSIKRENSMCFNTSNTDRMQY